MIGTKVEAHDIEAVNTDGVTIYYKWINDNTELAVSYRTVSDGSGGYYIYHEYSGNVVIPESITYNGAIYNVTSIDADAFKSCSGLLSVTIPRSVVSISSGIFAFSNKLSSIIVNSDNPKYDSRDNCNAIIETNNNVLIAGCKNTTIPKDVTEIGERAFYGCNGLSSITIPASVTSIGRNAFLCSGLTSITIPNGVTSIGRSILGECSNLSSIIVDSENTKYDSRDNCNAIIETASHTLITGCKNSTIPHSVTSISEYAFGNCAGLTYIEIPDNINYIGKDAFTYSEDLLSVKIGSGVSIIETETFAGCISLKTITIGANVQEIKSRALSGCGNLETIISLNTTPPTLTRTAFQSTFWRNKYKNVIIQVPIGSFEAYQKADVWKEFPNIEESDFSNSGNYYKIDELNFPDQQFRDYLLNEPYGKDKFLTEEEIASITTLNVSNLGISDLKGIEYFTALKKLLCYKNNLTELDLSANKLLKEVDCYSNQIMGIKMDSLLASLPTLDEGEGSLYVLDATDEGNICFATQVSYAKSKGWIVYHYTGSEWQEYEGRESGILIAEENFPDEIFREYLMKQDYGKDMIITDDEIKSLTSIYINDYFYMADRAEGEITSLKGIEYFTFLESLSCIGNKLKTLDVSKNGHLTTLSCFANQLTKLDVSKNTELIEIQCGYNALTSLDLSNNTTLTSVYCVNNRLTTLYLPQNGKLTNLSCHNNKLSEIDLTNSKELTWLNCASNQFTDLDISKNTALTFLYCASNNLKNLDVSKNSALEELACMGNQLTSLDVSKNLKLKTLKCQGNKINGERMNQLIESLPIQESAFFCVIDTYFHEENICTKKQVKKAKEKGWKVMCGYDGFDSGSGPEAYHPHYTEYEGSESRDIFIDEETFPDEHFRAYLLNQSYGKDGYITEEEIGTITSINVSYGCGYISSMKGIEYFIALDTLNCSRIGLESIDVSQNVALKILSCSGNKLTSLDVSKNTALLILNCYDNPLTSLDVSNNTSLTKLYCNNNQLSILDVSNNTDLKELNCCWNQLTKLDISNNTYLNLLLFAGNIISEEAMDVLIKGLPQRTQNTSAWIGVVDLTIESEGNVCTSPQVTTAKERGWSVRAHTGNGGWSLYEGSVPSGIQGVSLDKNASASIYNLNGRRLIGTRKGINIIGGKKLLKH